MTRADHFKVNSVSVVGGAPLRLLRGGGSWHQGNRLVGAAPRQVELEFGKSHDFRRATYASIAVSNPDFTRPEN